MPLTGYSNCPARARTPNWFTPFTTIAVGNPELGVHQVALNLVARVSGKPESPSDVLYDATHITDDDSKTIDVNVVPVVAGNTVGALAVPMDSVLPDSGGNTPLTKLVKEATPGIPDECAANSPPSGDMARHRAEPEVARNGGDIATEFAP